MTQSELYIKLGGKIQEEKKGVWTGSFSKHVANMRIIV